jgi:hypothetical protein
LSAADPAPDAVVAVNQLAVLVTVHGHVPDVVINVRVPAAPVAGVFTDTGDTAYVQLLTNENTATPGPPFPPPPECPVA